MKIDLHVHCKERSACAHSTEEEQIRRAIQIGLDAIVFTDHGTFVPTDRLEVINDAYSPFKVFGGIEITLSDVKIEDDFLVIGVRDPKLEHPGCEASELSYGELHAIVEQYKGYMALAHPFRWYESIIDFKGPFPPPHAIELCSSNMVNDGKRDKRERLARRWKCHRISNSDSHHTSTVGMWHNELRNPVRTEQELVRELKAGNYMMRKRE